MRRAADLYAGAAKTDLKDGRAPHRSREPSLEIGDPYRFAKPGRCLQTSSNFQTSVDGSHFDATSNATAGSCQVNTQSTFLHRGSSALFPSHGTQSGRPTPQTHRPQSSYTMGTSSSASSDPESPWVARRPGCLDIASQCQCPLREPI